MSDFNGRKTCRRPWFVICKGAGYPKYKQEPSCELKIRSYCNINKITNLCGIKPSQIVSCIISVTRCNNNNNNNDNNNNNNDNNNNDNNKPLFRLFSSPPILS